MTRSRSQHAITNPELTAKADRHQERQGFRADQYDRHRGHQREHLCHGIRCQEADREIREAMRGH